MEFARSIYNLRSIAFDDIRWFSERWKGKLVVKESSRGDEGAQDRLQATAISNYRGPSGTPQPGALVRDTIPLMQSRRNQFTVLVYRMPAKPTAGRVAVWRQLKKIGSIYLQQSVCVFPANSQVRNDLHPILEKITESGGEFHLLPLRQLDTAEESKLIQQFLGQASNHYREIIENCEINFTKEVEFETFRKNFTYEEAEEIRSEFEKICVWFERVHRRDWFGATNEAEARGWVARCEAMLEEFEARVFGKEDAGGSSAPTAPRRRLRHPQVISAGKTSTRSNRG